MTVNITTKTLRGKYQVAKNIYAACYLDILEATDKEIKTFVGLKSRADTTLPVGTRIYFDAEVINKINVRRSNSFDIFSIRVLGSGSFNDKPLHICTPIEKDNRPNMRKTDRKECKFPVMLPDTDANFQAVNGTVEGLTLVYSTRKAVLSLAGGHQYDFSVTYKGQEQRLPGTIKHIQYDWRSHEHIVGIQFGALSQEQATVIQLLLDPTFKVEISTRQTIDTALGKISRGGDLDLPPPGPEQGDLLNADQEELLAPADDNESTDS